MTLRRAAACLLVLAAGACTAPKPPAPSPPAPRAPTPAPTALPPAPTPAPPPRPVIPPPSAFLGGTVVYRQRVALTPEAEVQVELRDGTVPDSVSTPIAKQVISTPGQVPIPFSLEYDPTRILAGHDYALSARITDRGQLQFVTEDPVEVLSGGLQQPVEILVVPIR